MSFFSQENDRLFSFPVISCFFHLSTQLGVFQLARTLITLPNRFQSLKQVMLSLNTHDHQQKACTVKQLKKTHFLFERDQA